MHGQLISRTDICNSDVLMEGVVFSKMQEIWLKVGYAAREMVPVFSVTLFKVTFT